MFTLTRLRTLLPALFLLTLLALPATAGRRVYRLADYGIRPDNRTDSTIASRLDSVLRLIKAQTPRGTRAVIRFEPGRYDLHAADARPEELYISNHDQGQPKRVGILIDGWHDGLTLEGRGARIICHGRMLPLAVTQSDGVRLEHFAIDFEDPQITQVQVLKNDPSEGITFEVAPWSQWRPAADGRFEAVGEGWALKPAAGIAFDPQTRHILYNTADLPVDTRGIIDLGGGHARAPQWRDSRLKPGTIVALRTWERPAPGIFLNECTDTRLTNVNVHYAEGMGLLAQRCTDIDLRGFRVCLDGGDDAPRYFTTQADATHFSQCRGRIISRHGLYEGMMDDAINIHGIYLRVTERLDDHTLRCTFGHDQAWGFSWGDPGDTVSFVRADAMQTFPHLNTIRSIRPDGQADVKGCRGFIITLDKVLPAEITGGNAYGIEDLTWTPEVTFARNIVRNNRARGALFSSPRCTVCRDNLFDHTSGAAILLCGDCNGWFESGAVRDLVIKGNTFRNALTSLYQFTEAVISICPEIPRPERTVTPFHGGPGRSIVIEGNSFDTFDNPLLYVSSTRGLIFRRNALRRNHDFPPLFHGRKAVTLKGSTDCRIEGIDEQ